jgi:hypothetical protein
MYLLPSSCHPAHISNNIPYSLAYRIVRICSKPELRDAQFLKLRDFLLSRDYNSSIVDSALVQAKAIPMRSCFKESGDIVECIDVHDDHCTKLKKET